MVADEIADLGIDDQGPDTGFGTIHTDHDAGRVTVYWAGDPPQRLVDLAETRPQGIDVVVRESQFARADLDRAAAAIEKAGLDERLDIVSIDPDVTTGILVETSRVVPYSQAELELLHPAAGSDAVDIQYGIPPAVGYAL